MAARYVTLRMVVGEPQTGQWCDRCLLPSALLFPVHGLYPGGVFAVRPILACPDCGLVEHAAADRLGGGE